MEAQAELADPPQPGRDRRHPGRVRRPDAQRQGHRAKDTLTRLRAGLRAGALLLGLGLAPLPAWAGEAPPEPDGYRTEAYRAPVPATLAGATVVDTGGARLLWSTGRVPFLDILPYTRRPATLPEGTVWRPKPHDSIPGAIWLANTGYGALSEADAAWFLAALDRIAAGDPDAPLLFFCKAECWMSWNAARRAVAAGHSRVYWYPDGVDGWAAAGYALVPATPAPGAP